MGGKLKTKENILEGAFICVKRLTQDLPWLEAIGRCIALQGMEIKIKCAHGNGAEKAQQKSTYLCHAP